MSARKIGFLILILVFGAVVETAWSVRENRFYFGPEGLRILGGRFYGPSFTFEESTERAVSGDQELEIEVRNSFGNVRILPGEGASVRVDLRKVVFRPTEEKARAFAERVELRFEEEDGRVRISTNRNDVPGRDKVGFETHLDVHVPATAKAVVGNDHGSVEVSGIARAEIKASYGDVHVERIEGPVSIEARHGDVHATELGAELSLESRHGDVEVVGVTGHSTLDVQHGALTVRRSATFEAKAFHGAFAAESVGGDLTLEARHAGAVIADVAGSVDVQTSYESVRLERIGGNVTARVEHGSVRAEGVKGALTAETTHDGVWLDGVSGRVEVAVRGGGVEARELKGGAHVRSRGDVSIDGFGGTIDVETESGDILLKPGRPITEPVTASARKGAVRLEVPAGSRFALEAESRHGELVLDVPELESSSGNGRITGTMGGGGATVLLTADEDVTVAPGGSALPAERP